MDARCPICRSSARLVREGDAVTLIIDPDDVACVCGAIGICAVCGSASAWTESGTLREISPLEIAALSPAVGGALARARAFVAQLSLPRHTLN
jgi:hypothetical protein